VATFQHKRYPQLQLHDGETEWARFEAGRFATDDEDVVKRLRAATDPDLVEVKPEKQPVEPKPHPGADAGVDAIVAWVGDDQDKAREALAVEQGTEKPRSTLLAKLDKLAGN